jgi:hypothetical protein
MLPVVPWQSSGCTRGPAGTDGWVWLVELFTDPAPAIGAVKIGALASAATATAIVSLCMAAPLDIDSR